MGGKPDFTTLRKDTLSGATPHQIRSQTTELAPAQLRELAVTLAQDPDLTVSVITYENGMQELEVLHTGPPRHTEHTIDHRKFTSKPDAAPRILSIATRSALQDAAEAIRALLRDAQHGTGLSPCGPAARRPGQFSRAPVRQHLGRGAHAAARSGTEWLRQSQIPDQSATATVQPLAVKGIHPARRRAADRELHECRIQG